MSRGKFLLGFNKRNFVIMIIGALVIALGYLLISGGRSDKNDFDPATIFSFVRISLAPILILAGFGIISWGIFAKPLSPKSPQNNSAKA